MKYFFTPILAIHFAMFLAMLILGAEGAKANPNLFGLLFMLMLGAFNAIFSNVADAISDKLEEIKKKHHEEEKDED